MGNLSAYEDKMIEAFVQKPDSFGWYKMRSEERRVGKECLRLCRPVRAVDH